MEILEEYVFEHRSEFITDYQTDALLLSSHGKRMNDLTIAHRLKAIVDATENETIKEKNITMHTLRHSIATHLMQNKVSIQMISSFLLSRLTRLSGLTGLTIHFFGFLFRGGHGKQNKKKINIHFKVVANNLRNLKKGATKN